MSTNQKEEKAVEVSAGGKSVPRKKKLLKIAGMVLAGLVVLWILGILFLDWTIAAAVRNVVPAFTGTPVELHGVRVSVFSGQVELRGLKICNPAGFQHPYAFELDHFIFDLNTGTILSKKVEVEEISVNGMLVDYEPGMRGSNLGIIQSNLENAVAKEEAEEEAAEKTAEQSGKDPEDASGRKVIIRHLDVRNVKLASGSLQLPLPGFELNDLGDGKSLGETMDEFYLVLMQSVQKAVSSELVQGFGQQAGDAGSSLKKSVQDAGDRLKKLFE